MITRLTLVAVLALAACGGKDDGGKKDDGQGAVGKDGKPVKVDPTLSWKDQRGEGFVVLGAQAPNQQNSGPADPKDPLVTGVTTYTGYQPADFKGDFKITVTQYTDKVAEVDLLKLLREAAKAPAAAIPGTKVEEMTAIGGEVPGMDARYSGTDPQLGKFGMRRRLLFKNKILYAVDARYSTATKGLDDQALAFILSFKLTN
jgi:hypothetical protein